MMSALLLSTCNKQKSRLFLLTSRAFGNSSPVTVSRNPMGCATALCQYNANIFHLPPHFQKSRCVSALLVSVSRRNASKTTKKKPKHKPVNPKKKNRPISILSPEEKAIRKKEKAIGSIGHENIIRIPKTPLHLIFPWRHSTHTLPRLAVCDHRGPTTDGWLTIEGSKTPQFVKKLAHFKKNAGMLGPGWAAGLVSRNKWLVSIMWDFALKSLGIPFYERMIPFMRKRWQSDLAISFSKAFSSGLAQMIEDVYCSNGSNNVLKNERTPSAFDDPYSFYINLNLILNPGSWDHTDSSMKNGIHHEQYQMIEKKLRKIYQNANDHPHESKISITLKMVCHKSTVLNMYPIPGLSRNVVEARPELNNREISFFGFMADIYEKLKEYPYKNIKDYPLQGRIERARLEKAIENEINRRKEGSRTLTDDGEAVTTVVAQVLIQCREHFCVRDDRTQTILFGSNEINDVSHLVRFEIVVKESQSGAVEIGRWQIVDWDDLLEGSLWFLSERQKEGIEGFKKSKK